MFLSILTFQLALGLRSLTITVHKTLLVFLFEDCVAIIITVSRLKKAILI